MTDLVGGGGLLEPGEQLKEGVLPPVPVVERPGLPTFPAPDQLLEVGQEGEMPDATGGAAPNPAEYDMPAAETIVGNSVTDDVAGPQQGSPEPGPNDESVLADLGLPVPMPVPDPPPPSASGYVRVVIHVDGGQATVSAVSRVDGPLVTAGAVGGGNVWEVLVDGYRVVSDTVDDLMTWRSFPEPDATAGEHHVTESSSYNFTVRFPIGRVTPEALGRTQIRLYRKSSQQGPVQLSPTGRSLGEEFPAAVQELLHIPRLDDPALGPALVGRLQELLR